MFARQRLASTANVTHIHSGCYLNWKIIGELFMFGVHLLDNKGVWHEKSCSVCVPLFLCALCTMRDFVRDVWCYVYIEWYDRCIFNRMWIGKQAEIKKKEAGLELIDSIRMKNEKLSRKTSVLKSVPIRCCVKQPYPMIDTIFFLMDSTLPIIP